MKIITLKTLQDNFNQSIETVPNKQFLIDNEIRNIEQYINSIPNQRNFRNPKSSINQGIPNPTHKFKLEIPIMSRDLFSSAFNGYSLYEKFEISQGFHEQDEAFEHKKEVLSQAYEFVEYYNWAKKLKPSSKAQQKANFTHKQKLLILHYLGLDISEHDYIKSGKALQQVFGHHYDDTRDYIPQLLGKIDSKNEVRTKTNLKKVHQLFKEIGFIEISETIQEELNIIK